jgi:hypothetical protein
MDFDTRVQIGPNRRNMLSRGADLGTEVGIVGSQGGFSNFPSTLLSEDGARD